MRKVEVTVYNRGMITMDKYVGYFHAWGIECLETEGGAVTYTMAIIEDSDGFINMVKPDNVRFLKDEGPVF